ncbi:MAG: HAD-IIIC family phosphatase [Deltaproteobacteria bacterium]|nr:HAD-IIIC family phosphatase [Deltaproteobacteria bacterium]
MSRAEPSPPGLDAALAAPDRAALRAELAPRTPLAPAAVARLTQRLRGFAAPRTPLRLAVLRTYTTELLRPYWIFEALLEGLELELYEAPYGSVWTETDPRAGLAAHRPELTVVCLRWEDLDPRLAAPLQGLAADERRALADAAVAQLSGGLAALRAATPGTIVLTLLPHRFAAELGAYDAMAEHSEAGFRADLKRALAARLRAELPGVYFDDLDALIEQHGRAGLLDRRLWQTSRFPFSTAGAQAVARHLLRYAVLAARGPLKCIALDADNTLWGGVVGEDGPDGLALGPEYPGTVYADFQRRLLALQQRGVLLALCSKNNLDDVRAVLRGHPHQLLREAHFAAMRVNWEPKSANLRALAAELNLGLDAFALVDDSPHERAEVAAALPMVEVVPFPAQLVDLPHCLDELPRLEILALTDEDRRRTALYAGERARQAAAGQAGNVDDWLRSLGMVMTVGADVSRHLARIAQLTQKTNQFNLTTRRYGEDAVRRMLDDPDWLVADFSLADVYGDSGLVGVALVRGVAGAEAEIDTFLMSCRVIGRRAESAFLAWLLERLAARGLRRVEAQYVETAKNALVREFWSAHGFSAVAPGRFSLDLNGDWRAALPAAPIEVRASNGGGDGSL